MICLLTALRAAVPLPKDLRIKPCSGVKQNSKGADILEPTCELVLWLEIELVTRL